MDEQEHENGTFGSETVNLLILNELRLMRRDLKTGVFRLDRKIDDLVANKSKLHCLKTTKPVARKKIKSTASSLSISNYINKNKVETQSKQRQQQEPQQKADKNQAENVDSQSEPNIAIEESELFPCTVQVDISDFPDITNNDLDSHSDDTTPNEEHAANKLVFPVCENEEGRYVCSLCENSYTNKGNLRRHYRQHTGDMRYQCEVCDRRFFRNEYLIRHMRKHIKNAKEQELENGPSECARHDKAFVNAEDLKLRTRPRAIRRLISCDGCDKKFLEETAYQRHLVKVHAKDK